MDIVPLLARCGRGSEERRLLSVLLPAASLASLQQQLAVLVARCDQVSRRRYNQPRSNMSTAQVSSVRCLITLLTHHPDLARDNEKLVTGLARVFHRPGVSPELQTQLGHCLALVVRASTNNSDTGKTIAAAAPALINTVLALLAADPSPAPLVTSGLALLAALMSRYPGSCGAARPRILERLVSRLLGSGRGRVQLVGRCLALACQVGGGGREGAEHCGHYSSLVHTIVATVHTGLSTLLAGVKELDTFPDLVSLAPPWPLEASLEKLAWQLETAMALLGRLLTAGFPHPRRVIVDTVLSLPVRLLSAATDPRSPQQQLVASLHSALCCSSLQLTSALVTSAGAQLAPEAGRINSLLVAALSRPHVSPRVRTEVYTCLAAWLQSAGLSSGVEHCAGQLVPSILADIAPATRKMVLQATTSGNKRGKKRKGGGGGGGQSHAAAASPDTDLRVDPGAGEAAVRALEQVVGVVGAWLDPETHASVTQCVLTQLLAPDLASPRLVAGLVSVLQLLATSASPRHLSPLQLALPALARLSSRPGLSLQIRSSLASLQSVIHPARHSLDVQDCKTATLNTLTAEDIEEEEDTDTLMADVSIQTDNIVTADTGDSSGDNESVRKIRELEEMLRKVKESESAAKTELMRKDIEISRMKIWTEKQLKRGNSEKVDDGELSKKVKMDQQIPEVPDLEFPSSDADPGGDQLSVADMLKDFSDKLNDNIVPKFTHEDSDSD